MHSHHVEKQLNNHLNILLGKAHGNADAIEIYTEDIQIVQNDRPEEICQKLEQSSRPVKLASLY